VPVNLPGEWNAEKGAATLPIAFKPEETFRDDFTFRNSPEAILRFPFPFAEDAYMYSVNIEPHTAGPKGSCYEFPIDIDEHYVAECREREICLKEPGRYLPSPTRCRRNGTCSS
jgi:hypothetical protein